MAKALPDLRMTVAEVVRWPGEGTDTRYELAAGRTVATAPPSGRHAGPTRNVFRAPDRRVRPPCRALFGAGTARHPEGDECRLPDVFVNCEPTPGYVLTAPRVVVEVPFPTTDKEDRTIKLDFGEALPSVEAVLPVWHDRRRGRLHSREEPRWPAQDLTGAGVVPLAGLGVERPLDEACAGLDLSPAPSRPGD